MKMKLGMCVTVVVVVAALSGACAEEWRWAEAQATAGSVRIDTKVRFIDNDKDNSRKHREPALDEVPFKEAVETEGFYNRPRGAGRYPVRVEEPQPASPALDHRYIYPRRNKYDNDGTLDSLQYCKCVSTPDCNPHEDSARACGSGKFLCCYKKPYDGSQQNTEYFNEIDDERPMLLPGRESIARPFPPPPGGPALLVGPQGPTGRLGPDQNPSLLVGPITYGTQKPAVLVGPGGPTGVIGPVNANKGLLSPDLPIDPIHPEESAQRGVLVGPGGPTGIIGPQGGYGRRGVLVGPGGPTGIIGPRRPAYGGFYNPGYGRPMGRGLLVGPGGPTGTIGPGRGLLVGPGGPTGMIGPQSYFGK